MSQAKEKLEALVAKREKVFSRVQVLLDLSKSLSKENFATFKARYEKIDEHYSDFDRIQDEINAMSSKVEKGDAVETKQSSASFEEMYYAVKAAGLQYLKETPRSEPVQSNPPVVKPKLPDINIPTFSGDIKSWLNFHALFESLIHKNISLPNVEKLQFLRTYVKGPALGMIEHLPLTNENYMIAYNALLDRYQNKRMLASHYLGQMDSFKPLFNDHLNGLNHYLDVFKTNCAALQALNIDNLADFLLLHTAIKALDPQTKKSFESKYCSSDIPTFDNLMNFVQDQCKISELSQVQTARVNVKPSHQPTKPTKLFSPQKHALMSSLPQNSNVQFQQSARSQSSCPLCKEPHKIQHCHDFIAKPPSERHGLIKSWKRCFNCFGNHLITSCTSTSQCKRCQRSSHHTLLHFSSPAGDKTTSEPYKTPSSEVDGNKPSKSSLSCNMKSQSKEGHTVLLGTAQALITDSKGDYQTIRLVIDPGSQVSCITSSCVQRLGLRPSKSNLLLTGIGNTPTTRAKGSLHCTLFSRANRSLSVSAYAVILQQISANLPSTEVSQKVIDQFKNLELADPSFHRTSKIDFLLGADVYPYILSENTSPIKGEPCAIATLFGWILIGKAPADLNQPSSTSLFVSSPSLDTLINKFWEIEEVTKAHYESPEDVFCESYFQKTISRDHTGRYIVSYPFKESPTVLGTSRQTALKRLHKLEFRLENNLNLKTEYHEFLSEYEHMDHMSIATSDSDYIIPHHCVISNSGSSGKLRVVFDGSAKGNQGLSLNEILLKGPKLQKDITDIILNFRLKPIALVADCKMMYRMILIDKHQRKYQHIFWRDDLSSPVKEYELNTVTYGLTPSSYLAQRVLQQLVTDEGETYPEAAKTVTNNMYVDDIVVSVSTEEEALELQNQLIGLFHAGGFSLRKWAGNSTTVLNALPKHTLQTPLLLNSDEECTTKILGLEWEPHSDTFCYTVVTPDSSVDTKRSILSHISRIFDPVGWLCPTVFFAKHLMQLLWQSKVGWDDTLPVEIYKMWNDFKIQLPELTAIRITRHTLTMQASSLILVGFSVAGENGYGAVTYVLSNSNQGKSSIMLLKAKSKVAPLKSQSVPRLELCGALLLAQLIKH